MEPGVSGIVATKLVERYKRPTIFITPDHGHGRGSIRSFENENVLDLLNLVSDLLIHFGGHKEAGGFSIELKNIPILEERLKTAALTWLQQSSTSSIEEQSSVSLQPTEVTETLFKELQYSSPLGKRIQSLDFLFEMRKLLVSNQCRTDNMPVSKFSVHQIKLNLLFGIVHQNLSQQSQERLQLTYSVF